MATDGPTPPPRPHGTQRRARLDDHDTCPVCVVRGEPAKMPNQHPGEFEWGYRCPQCGLEWVIE